MKIAITGATGFIGHHVLKELARQGVESIAVVRPSNLESPTLPCAKTVFMDIQDAPANAFELLGKPDALINLAWGGLPNYRSLHHFEQELPEHYQFLKTLITSGLENLITTGTCFEYGMQSGPLNEDMEPQPSTPYGFAKDTLRRQLEYLKISHPFNLVWSRLFYLYGEGQAESSLFTQLVTAVKRGDTAFDMSGGEQLRDYLPVSEVAKSIVSLALKRADIGAVNICSGQPISVRKLVEGWIMDNGWSISLNLGRYPYPDHEPMAFWGDKRKLQMVLGVK
ncbi:MAG: NAD(P)-dependent oxidoreductase [Desulfobulbaceae bacterium]|nr:NAD(P)-dependent oxidoreductase [Desulfobulbaceae bacterium]